MSMARPVPVVARGGKIAKMAVFPMEIDEFAIGRS
jgi:hypothetical protein